MVRYPDRSVVAHTGLTEGGCRVLSFRRLVSTWQHQRGASRLRGEECSYGEEEAGQLRVLVVQQGVLGTHVQCSRADT